jgi:hypothetical protein
MGRSFNLMRRKTDVIFAANPEIYYQDLRVKEVHGGKKVENHCVK